jgi:hypothetical protein
MGGRLINDLNADPYSVVLLDEVEKAHPDIWKPFLNLFDEGWMVDQRNVRAYGNRAIFILTSNAGADKIAELVAKGASMESIVEAVKQELFKIEHPTARLKCFTPEFLARITQIIIFNPLSLEAMQAITKIKLQKLTAEWQEKRNKKLDIADHVYDRIAELGHRDNQKANGREGGRIIPKYVANLVETPLMDALANHPDEYQRANCVRVSFDPAGRTLVRFESAEPASPRELNAQIANRIAAVIAEPPDSAVEKQLKAVDALLRTWEQGLREWTLRDPGSTLLDIAVVEQMRERLASIRHLTGQRDREAQAALLGGLRDLGAALAASEPVKSAFATPSVVAG